MLSLTEVLLLPPLTVAEHSFRLPVSAECCASLALRVNDRPITPASGGWLLTEPGLILFWCHQFHSEMGSSPQSLEELCEFACASWNRDCMAAGGLDKISGRRRRLAKCVDDFGLAIQQLRDTGSLAAKPLRRALRQFASSSLGLKKRFTRGWIKQIASKQLCCSILAQAEIAGESPRWGADEVLSLTAEIGRIQAEFTDRLEQEKLLSIKELAYGASHEINNPLANIAARAQSMMADEPHPEKRHRLSVIYHQAMRAHEMISDLMLFGNPPQPDFQPTDLYDLCKAVVCELAGRFRKTGIVVQINQYPGTFPVACDRVQIAEAIKAMLVNSAEAIGRNGRIEIRLWPKTDDLLTIRVTDDGCGVSDRAARHLFDPYFSGREAGRGLGFGLSKAWAIISRLHGGKIECRNGLAGKTEFEIQLPRKKNAVAGPIPGEGTSPSNCKPRAA